MKKRAIIFGVGNNFIYTCNLLEKKYEIVGLADNDYSKQGAELFGYKVSHINTYPSESYDFIIITPTVFSEVFNQLVEIGIDKNRLICLEDALNTTIEKKTIRIAALIYGGMGDYIIAKNWLYHLNRMFSIETECIDLYFQNGKMDTAVSIFDDCEWIDNLKEISIDKSDLIYGKYDLIIWFSIFPYVREMNEENVFRVNKKFHEHVSLIRKFGWEYFYPGFFASPLFYKSVKNIFLSYPNRKYHTHFDVLGDLGASDQYLCEVSICIDEDSYLHSIDVERKEFITLDTGLNEEYLKKSNSRAWSHNSWDCLGKLIKRKYPTIKVVQVGLNAGDSEDITADIHLNGKTDIEQIKVLMKNALLHVDYDGGLVHLRHALCGGISIVLFGPSSIQTHSYEENVAIRTSDCHTPCEWTGPDWLVNCQKDYKIPLCMNSIRPQMVMDKIEIFMESNYR